MSSAVLRRAMTAVVVAGTMVAGPAGAFAADGGKAAGVERISGADRYEAAANVSEASFAPGVPVAYVASGAVFTDALSGAPVAAKTGGPMLLVKSSEVPSVVATELRRLAPKKIVILGGPNSVDYNVEAVLASYTSGGVERWMGADRYEASAQISQESFSPGVNVAYVASGLNFPDALSGAPVAGMGGSPMLLTDDDRLPSAIAEELVYEMSAGGRRLPEMKRAGRPCLRRIQMSVCTKFKESIRMNLLTDKVALVTGGSRGLGKDMALRLAEKKRGVILTYNNKREEAEAVVEQIRAMGGRATALQLNLSTPHASEAFVHQVRDPLQSEFGGARLLVEQPEAVQRQLQLAQILDLGQQIAEE